MKITPLKETKLFFGQLIFLDFVSFCASVVCASVVFSISALPALYGIDSIGFLPTQDYSMVHFELGLLSLHPKAVS